MIPVLLSLRVLYIALQRMETDHVSVAGGI